MNCSLRRYLHDIHSEVPADDAPGGLVPQDAGHVHGVDVVGGLEPEQLLLPARQPLRRAGKEQQVLRGECC